MVKNIFLYLFFLGFFNHLSAQSLPLSSLNSPAYYQKLNQSKDLNLPSWGPYTKRYAGTSYIPNVNEGLRFDIGVMPGFYRRKILIPNVMWESGFHPWRASSDLSFYTYRYELEWKDSVYADISFVNVDSKSQLIHAEMINNTCVNQDVVLHYLMSMQFPSLRPYSLEPIKLQNVSLPSSSVWVDDMEYKNLEFAKPTNQNNLVYDGYKRGEGRENNCIKGTMIGAQNRNSPWCNQQWGMDRGDWVEYEVDLKKPFTNPMLVLRYRTTKSKTNSIQFSGIVDTIVRFSGSGIWETKSMPIDLKKTSKRILKFTALGGDTLDLDGFTVVEKEDLKLISFPPLVWNPKPVVSAGPTKNSTILKYENSDQYYGVAWDFESVQIREFLDDQLDVMMQKTAQNHTALSFSGNGLGHYLDLFLRPIPLKPHQTQTINAFALAGTKQEVENGLLAFKNKAGDWNTFYKNRQEALAPKSFNSTGNQYLKSQELMNATLLTNVVYPVYTQANYIRHYTPGRTWDCLYTWDSGFIGLGLSFLDVNRAIECLNTYTMPVGAQSAFLHHGTPLPVQIHLFYELWNATQSEELLHYFYPRLKQYYDFLMGGNRQSTTNTQQSGLIRTFDYFYNSGGWDDYPPQEFVHKNKLAKTTVPIVNTSHQILCAKILKQAAIELGMTKDVKQFDADISKLSSSLQKYAWDKESGYFGYVLHDSLGMPKGILKYENKTNYDMGLDGAYPVLTGLCTEVQKKTILANLKTEGKIWSNCGLSAVDQSAPYYSKEGYWNGSVWFPHQWFFWKGMFDLGEGDFALIIANTALNLWKKETEQSYNCFEHFMIDSERGAGWHQFGGLSSPVVVWFHDLYKQGTVTTGYSVFIKEKTINQNNTTLKMKLKNYNEAGNHAQILVCMNESNAYTVKINNKPASFRMVNRGLIMIDLPENVLDLNVVIN